MKMRNAVLILVGAAICAGLALFRLPEQNDGIPAATAEERQIYLFSQGFKGREETAQEITVPDTEDAIFADYAALQEAQGLPLAAYAGQPAVQYVFRLEQSELYAELLVSDGILIGAMCCDPAKHTMLRINGKPFP